ncbi:hypothetical protein TorRG33x02_319600 [Trema orientale]|uniref:Uncharacterized protein n=1 Tax=Trema orientale TaxID=63057 RepID=A0A2P5BIP5_TREOI|nr:hypothetical protein TorRG33x02_319600 [Trema orientale]
MRFIVFRILLKQSNSKRTRKIKIVKGDQKENSGRNIEKEVRNHVSKDFDAPGLNAKIPILCPTTKSILASFK